MLTDTIWKNARLATMKGAATGAGEIGAVDNGMIAAKDGRIVYAGPAADAPALDAREIVDCAGRWITPGLIDCHTHLIHGGDRAAEFEMRLEGASYEEIARGGGGIVSTMRATRAASEDDLVASALPRLDALIAEGATTVEVKSGYGLDGTSEIRMLRAARALGAARAVSIRTTFLGAHALPPEFAGNADGYIALLCDEVLPRVAQQGLADAVDAFCEGIAFSPEQTARMFEAAARHGLPVKLHADQLSNLHGAALAARHGALSADHLEHCDAAGIAAMARAGTVATLLRDMGFEMSWVFDDRSRPRTAVYAQFADADLAKRAFYALQQAVVPWDASDRFVVRRVTDARELQREIESSTRIFVNISPDIYRGRALAKVSTEESLSPSEVQEATDYFVELWCARPPRRDENIIAFVSRCTGLTGKDAWRLIRPMWYKKSDLMTKYDLTDFITIMMQLIN